MGVFRRLGCVGGYPVMGGYTVKYVSAALDYVSWLAVCGKGSRHTK
jgi:hypothetical protein